MTKPFSVIFAGTPEFAVPSLKALIDDPAYDVQLVITQSDKPVGRKQEMTPPPVKLIAQQHGIEVAQPEDINNFEFRISNFDFLVTVAYGQILKQSILDLPTIAAVNLHASLLPKWRGASPMQSALLAGDAETGVTLQRMTEKLDAGDILAQEKTSIDARETISSLHDRLATISAQLLVDALKKPLEPTPQNEVDATTCKKLSRKDGEVDPQTMTAQDIDLRARALVPWPGVTCAVQGNDVKLLRTALEKSDDAYELSCAEGTTLYIEEMQSPGKKPLKGAEWARGLKLLLGLFIIPLLLAVGPLDSDGDDLLDSEEDLNGNGVVDAGETDYLNADTDGGGEADGSEIRAGRDPFNSADDYTYDQDGDGLSNGTEASLGTNPNKRDTDGDGVPDADDPFPLDHRYKEDKDRDGIPDEYEIWYNLSDTDETDAEEDTDNDGIINRDEFILGTDPTDKDTDDDGIDDGDELEAGTDPEENPCLQYGGGSAHFADLEDHWSKNYVLHLHQTKGNGSRIVQGYTEGNRTFFLPNRPITRFELLKIALFASCTSLLDDTSTSATKFTDVASSARPRETDDRKLRRQVIYTAVEEGIVEGYRDGSFRPDDHINRAEALKILLLSGRPEILDEPYLSLPDFDDVTNNDWFVSYVKLGAVYDYVEGFGDGRFRPELPITRAEASKIVLLLMISNHRVNGYVIPVDDL